MMIKQGSRILAINDSPFSRSDRESLIVGILGREGPIIEGAISFRVHVDGNDSAERIIGAVRRSRFSGQVKLIALNGTTLAGLNIVDVARIRKELKVEVLAVTRKRPHPELLRRVALRRSGREKARMITRLKGEMALARKAGFYVQYAKGAEPPSDRLVSAAAELLRVCHIVASGVARGESRGKL